VVRDSAVTLATSTTSKYQGATSNGQRSEEISNADRQQTTGGNKQNFEAHNARPNGGAMRERPRGDAASARWVLGGFLGSLGDDSDLFSLSTTTLYQISLQPHLES
jgi:hypothetical protein